MLMYHVVDDEVPVLVLVLNRVAAHESGLLYEAVDDAGCPLS